MTKRTRRGDPRRRTYWEAVVRRWRESGQSVRAFCRAEELRESALYFWRRKLAHVAGVEVEGNGSQLTDGLPTPVSRAPSRVSPKHSPTPSFLPVRVVEPNLAAAARGVEIILTEGCTVRVPPGFDRQTLANVLAVLEVRPC